MEHTYSYSKEKPTGPASTVSRASLVGKLGVVHSGSLIVVVDGVSQEQAGVAYLDGWRDTTAKPVLHALSAAMLGPAQKLGNPSRATQALDQLAVFCFLVHTKD